ncbi:MAG: SLC13 family permease [Planctomycetota bacterium]
MNMRWMGALILAAVGVLLALLEPFPALSRSGHQVLMGLLIGVGLWIFQPGKLAFAVATCLVLAIFLMVGVDAPLVFAGFTSSTIWILLPATAFGYVLTKTGLGKRIALLVIKTFHPSYLNMTLAWLIIGLILSAFTPSIVIRIAIVMPIAVSCAGMLKLEPGSRGNAYILLIAWAMAIIPGSGWLTGSLWGPITLGMYDKVESLSGTLTSRAWMAAMALPMFVLTVLVVAGLYVVLRPRPLVGLTRDSFAQAYRELGPWSRQEKTSTVILVLAFALFMTETLGLHHLNVVVVCLAAFFAFYAFGVLDTEDFSKGIAWNLLVFLGGVLSLTGIFKATGVSGWIEGMIFPALAPFEGLPWLFVLVLPLFMFAWRFIDIAWMIPTISLLVALLPSIQNRFGIHPLVLSCLMIMAGNFALLTYMQPFAFLGSTLSGERSWTPGQLCRYGLVYLVSCVGALAASLLYWQATGFLGAGGE